MAMQITMITLDEEFVSLGDEWNALLSASGQDSPYLRHERLLAWWRVYCSGCELRVLVCRDGEGALLGVLPAYGEIQGALPGARAWRLLGDAHAGSTGLGPFARADVADAVLDEFAAHLRGSDDWDVLDFRFVDARGPFFARELASEHGTVAVREDVHASPIVELAEDFESYLMNVLAPKKREIIRRCRKRTAAAGARIEVIERAADLERALDDAFRLFENRMRFVVGPQFSASPEYREFARRTAEDQLARGQLRLGFMTIEGARVAFAQLFRYGETLYTVRGGFEADWGRLEVLKALNSHMLERGMDEGCRRVDYGLGDQEYKNGWGVVETLRFSDVSVYSGSVASRVARTRRGLIDWGTDTALAAPEGVRKPLLNAGRQARKLLRGGKSN